MAQSGRKFLITLNNPEIGLSDYVSKIFEEYKPLYICGSEEFAPTTGTKHYHVYFVKNSVSRWESVRKFTGASDLQLAKGTSVQNRDYVFKDGKHKDTDKSETHDYTSHVEMGECPIEQQGKRSELEELYLMIEQGLTTYEIIKYDPRFITQIDRIDKVRQGILEAKFKDTFRQLEVTYIHGDTGTGKSRKVMEMYGYSNVYRISDYKNPFDGYKGEDVIIFEEFHSSLKITDMLTLLDGYPVQLPCRYNNKIACYTKVYFATNIPLEMQYIEVQKEKPETYNALLRRIHNIEAMYKFVPVDDLEQVPFEATQRKLGDL